MFAQDRWRVNDRLMFELGLRMDRDDIVERVNYLAARGHVGEPPPGGPRNPAGGFGKFSERTPLTVGAFTQYEAQTSQPLRRRRPRRLAPR